MADVAAAVARARATRPSWWRQATLVLSKDVAVELRTGEVSATTGFFAVLVVVVASMAFYVGPETRAIVAPGAIWLAVAFAAILALGRAWHRERDDGALAGLLVAPVSRSAIFAGKALGILLFLALVEAIVVPLAALFFAVDLTRHGVGLVVICACASPGIAATGTLFGAMTVRTRARDLVLATVLFPLLAPTLLAAVVATRELLGGVPIAELGDVLKFMIVFDVSMIAGGLAMFGPLVED